MRLMPVFLTVSFLMPTLAVGQTETRPSGLPLPPVPSDFIATEADWVALGRQLFFDPVLSGNNNIACATCHHPALGTADAMSLSIGEGGLGLGADRQAVAENMPKERIPRHAPVLWNLGAREFVVMFHDGRVERDSAAPFGIRMPEGRSLERAVSSPLAAQNILPLLSGDEMAGQPGENPIADAVAEERIQGPDGAWDLIVKEVEAIPAYRAQLDWMIGDAPLHITDLAKALSSFIAFEFRATNSPFDAYLRGQDDALTEAQRRGMALFYGAAHCSTCHSGTYQTDHSFHAIGLPQFGPGKETDMAGYADRGRGHVTGNPADAYRFRTPSLRNVTLTAPYGHNGAYGTLDGMVRHHLDPFDGLGNYDRDQARLHPLDTTRDDWVVMDDLAEMMRIATSVEITPIDLSEEEINDVLAFLEALTDPKAAQGRLGVPAHVPSGLPLDQMTPGAAGNDLAAVYE